jgi:hypothetical protein
MAKYIIDRDEHYGWAVFERTWFLFYVCVHRSCDYGECVEWIREQRGRIKGL